MQLLLSLLVIFIILEHIGFLILEMFFWNKPLGLKIFKLTPKKAEATKALAANQGKLVKIQKATDRSLQLIYNTFSKKMYNRNNYT